MRLSLRAISRLAHRLFSHRDEGGQTLVEAALTFPLLFLLFFGIIEFSLVIFSYNTISNAAREGARWGVISTATNAQIIDAARKRTTGIQCTQQPLRVEVDPSPPPGTVKVDVYCDVPMITQMMVTALGGSGTIPLHASATMQVE